MSLRKASVNSDDNGFSEFLGLRLCCSEMQLTINSGAHMPIISLGSEAARILRHCQTGRILAVFKRSFYVQCGGRVICAGLPSLGEGPLHVLLESNQTHLPEEIVNGLCVNVSVHCPQYTDSGSGSSTGTGTGNDNDNPNVIGSSKGQKGRLYDGTVIAKTLSLTALQLVQKSLRRLVPPQPQGFGWLVSNPDWHCQKASPSFPDTGDALTLSFRLYCMPALLGLSQWLQHSLETQGEKSVGKSVEVSDNNSDGDGDGDGDGDNNKKVHYVHRTVAISDEMSSQAPRLLGAGLGLTPAGDDLLAGIMLALHRIDRADLAGSLWELLKPMVAPQTNIISAAHMQLAARGQCSEPMLQLLECLFSKTIIKQRDCGHATADNIHTLANRMGASSGWDTLAGMTLVLRAL